MSKRLRCHIPPMKVTCGGSGVLVFILKESFHLFPLVERLRDSEVLCPNKWDLQLIEKAKISLYSEDYFLAVVALYVITGSVSDAIMEGKPRDKTSNWFPEREIDLACCRVVVEVLSSLGRNSFHWVSLGEFQLLIPKFTLKFVRAVVDGNKRSSKRSCWMDEVVG